MDVRHEGVDFAVRARSRFDCPLEFVPVPLTRIDRMIVAHPRWRTAVKPTHDETLEHLLVLAHRPVDWAGRPTVTHGPNPTHLQACDEEGSSRMKNAFELSRSTQRGMRQISPRCAGGTKASALRFDGDALCLKFAAALTVASHCLHRAHPKVRPSSNLDRRRPRVVPEDRMTGTLTLLTLAGHVALLLWGVHMVSTGVMRAFGSDLRRVLGQSLRYRANAFLVGLGVTAALQSSTAAGLMATSFVASGVIGLGPALAVMLGANVGTTLIVQILSFRISLVAPILILVGVVAFRHGGRTRTRDLGRVWIGLGLILLALHMLVVTIEPAAQVPALRAVFGVVASVPVVDVLIAAVLAWAAHSSVAVVILIMSLAGAGVVSPTAVIALVLGANLGSAINPVLEGAGSGSPASRRLPVGNLLTRVVGVVIALPLAPQIVELLLGLETGPARLAANFHTAFNLALAIPFFVVLPATVRLLERLLPDRPVAGRDPGTPIHLDESALSDPHLALANAARETLRMADIVEAMLRGVIDVFGTDDRKRAAEISRTDDDVDSLHRAVKLYLTKISRDGFDDEASRRYSDVLSFAINLEHIGDIIDKNLMELATKKIRFRLTFSAEGTEEIHAMCERLLSNLKLAIAVFMAGDVHSAARLIAEKDVFRELERQATDAHFARLREGRPESIETSALHLDILRDTKRINSHIAAAGYPALDTAGGKEPVRRGREMARASGGRQRPEEPPAPGLKRPLGA
jgi:phosphate:Na+ symporter